MDCDVVIVGAGAAGLMAARELSRAGRSVVVIEARDRLGGRLYEISDPRALAPIELGGEFVHGRPAITYGLLREYGATVVDDSETHLALRNGKLEPVSDDDFSSTGDLLARALQRDTDESVDALIARLSADEATREAGRWARRLVSGFDAADPARASARAVAREWAGDASADGAQSRPEGGYAPLIAHLARSLDPALVDVRARTIAKRITRGPSSVEIEVPARASTATIRARYAVVTIPHGVLAAEPDGEGALVFDPPLPAPTRAAIAQIEMGPVVKVVLCFRTAFWEALDGGRYRDGAFFSNDGAFPTLWTQLPRRANTLVAWAGGIDAVPLRNASAAERIALALHCVGTMFGNDTAAGDAFECAYTHDWQTDPFARGAYTYVLVGGEHARAELAKPIDARIWIAGEATASDGEGGTVAGALTSGARAAREILALA